MGSRKQPQPKTSQPKTDDLSDKREAFVNAYFLCGFNATAAAKKAGYSEKTAYSQGHRLLKDDEIASRIRARMDEEAMSANEVLHRIAAIARGDFGELIDSLGNPDIAKAKEEGRTFLIKKIRTRTITTEESDITENELEPYDSLRALELLAKHHKLLTDKQEITGADGGAIPILITGMDVNEL